MEINVNLMRTRADRWRFSKFVAVLAVWTAATAGLLLAPATAAQAAIPGGLLTWGDNTFGQLCNGGAPGTITPTAVPGVGAGVTAIAAGANHTLFVSGGAVFACGLNRFGQLGNNGAPVNSAVPVAALAPANANIVAVSAGWDHSLSLIHI